MLNEKKIRLMTKLAIFEEQKGREELKLNQYYKLDYVRFQLLKTVLCVTIGFFLILCMIGFYKSEYLIAEAVKLDYQSIGMHILGFYLITLTVYIFGSIILFSFKYDRAKKGLTQYRKNLKALRNFYREEERESK